MSFLPPSIWTSEPWSASVGSPGLYSIEHLAESVFAAATAGSNVGKLELRGLDVAAIASSLDRLIDEAVSCGDYTQLLAPDRAFYMWVTHWSSLFVDPDACLFSVDWEDEVVSFGHGVEREVVFTLLAKYYSKPTEWFHERADGHSTLRIVHPALVARLIPATRLRDCAKFGATCALALTYGMTLGPHFGPGVLQYIIHGCDLASLHPAFVGEWYPELKRTISDWIAAGPDGDITAFQSHFAIYHDMQVSQSCRSFRDHVAHMFYLHKDLVFTRPHHRIA